jgi:molybdate transport system permease protein
MDWAAFVLSLKLAGCTVAILIPASVALARVLAWRSFPGRWLVQALIALPLVLPPTVLGFYLLMAFAGTGPFGGAWEALFGTTLAFSFPALVAAALVFNLPFAVQPIQRAFDGVPREVREAAWCSGMSSWRTFWRVELPLAWMGIVSAVVFTFAHTLGEFGVVLMVGGNIPGETRTISIAIYDSVHALDTRAAGVMAAILLAFSFTAIGFIYVLNERFARREPR